jgi:hypothetical protein
MTSNQTILDLMKRYVLWQGEEVERVREWPDGLALATPFRHFAGGPEPESWSISREEWVKDVVVVTRDDLIVEGQAERFGFLLLTVGGNVYVNDPAAVAELGRGLADGMDPLGYAEILVQFHPYSSAVRGVFTETDELRRRLGRDEFPDVEPPRIQQTSGGVSVRFSSFARYRPIGGSPLLDLTEWTVEVPTGEQARWQTRLFAEGVRLGPVE